jgi:hypothetical protein
MNPDIGRLEIFVLPFGRTLGIRERRIAHLLASKTPFSLVTDPITFNLTCAAVRTAYTGPKGRFSSLVRLGPTPISENGMNAATVQPNTKVLISSLISLSPWDTLQY